MLGCRVVNTPIEQNYKLCVDVSDQDKEQYQKLMDQLIYLCHTRPNIAYTLSVMNMYMHDLREQHIKTIHKILRFIKESSENGL
jgi:hypothetical protein